jgi:glutamine amidotransferase
MIAIVDYGMGNLRSLRNAFDYVGIDVEVVSEPAALAGHSHVVLPGVGAFGNAVANLAARGFVEALRSHVKEGRPLLGICLGMQLLASRGYEFGEHAGLDLIPGRVVAFEASDAFPVPHVGWNDVHVAKRHPAFAKTKKDVDYYFVHSFHFVTDDAEHVVAKSDYGPPFTAVVGRGSVLGTQFHPEKSQASGLALLEGFAEWDGRC